MRLFSGLISTLLVVACQVPATRLTTGTNTSPLFQEQDSQPATVIEVIPLNIETPDKKKLDVPSRTREETILLNVGEKLNFVFNISGLIPSGRVQALWTLGNPALGSVDREHTFTARADGETVLTLNLEGHVFNYLLKILDPARIEVPSLNSATKPITDFTVFVQRISPGTLGGDTLPIFDFNQSVPVLLEVSDQVLVSRINIFAQSVASPERFAVLAVNGTNVLNSLWNPAGRPTGEYEMIFEIASDRFGEVVLRRRFFIRGR